GGVRARVARRSARPTGGACDAAPAAVADLVAPARRAPTGVRLVADRRPSRASVRPGLARGPARSTHREGNAAAAAVTALIGPAGRSSRGGRLVLARRR